VFTGGRGAGKSRVAGVVARLYWDLGLLRYGELIEIAAADLTGTTLQETGTLVVEAIRPSGDLLIITDAHTWQALPDRGRHVLRCVYQQLTEARKLRRDEELAVILSGQAGPLRDLLRASPALAARFQAADVLAHAEARQPSGNARLAVRLLTQVTATQARRITTASKPPDPAALSTIAVADIPGHLDPDDPATDDERPGQYL
jgi:AAA lid domain